MDDSGIDSDTTKRHTHTITIEENNGVIVVIVYYMILLVVNVDDFVLFL